MSPLSRQLAVSLLVVGLSGCDCSTSAAKLKKHDGGTLPDGGHLLPDGGTGLLSDGGVVAPDGGVVPFSGTLRISPRDAVVDLTPGQAPAPVQFSATADGQPVTPSWTASPPNLGGIDATGRFTASGSAGGLVTIGAGYGAAQDSTSVRIRLHLSQNGAADGGVEDAGFGGVGGVGGEGVGGPVDPGTLAVLSSTPTADPGQALLYPYDGTVWPKDLLAPLLQWSVGGHPPEAVAIHLECPNYSWDGTFAQTASPFTHHPIPQEPWRQLGVACAGQTAQLRVVFASGGAAYGPLTETWTISAGSLKGVVYYNSYGSKLAYNYGGALPNGGPFGGATLAVRGGSTDPVLVAGQNGGVADCRVCHVVSADGSTLLSQHGDTYEATSSYALKAGNVETTMAPADGRFAWGGISPDGTLLFSNAAPMMAASTADSALFRVPSGDQVPTTGLPAGLKAGSPVFSPDGTRLAFNWYAGGGGGDQRTLAMMRFTPPGDFSDLTPLFTPPAGQTAMYPSFLPTVGGVVFENELVSNGRSFGETRSTCDSSGPCSDVGAHGELWWVDLATKQAARLDRLNGRGYLPQGPEAHDDDSTLNYEPTVGPIASGGYAWVIFTSRRLYGNVATLNPFWSDPRFHDLSQSPTTKKLWVAALDLNAPPGSDISHPAFYLPAQELLAGNSRGYWSLNPCHGDGEGCGSGDECCGGYCRGTTELDKVCSSSGGGCSKEFEKCSSDAECCNTSGDVSCVNGRCTVIPFR